MKESFETKHSSPTTIQKNDSNDERTTATSKKEGDGNYTNKFKESFVYT